MTGRWPLAGRRTELGRIATAVEQDQNGLVIAGTAGVGKSRLAAEVVAQLESRGVRSVHAFGSSASRSIPFGALAHLLPTGTAGGDGPLNPVGWALEAIRGPGHTSGPRRRLLFAVDDAHLLDGASAAVVSQLARTDDVFLLVTLRSGEPAPDAVQSLWKDGLLDRVELMPLSEPESAEMIGAVLGGQVDAMSAHRLWRVTGGHPLYLRELLIAGQDAGSLVQRDGVFVWSGQVSMAPRLAELITARLGVLDDQESTVLELVAFGEPVEVSTLAALAPAAAIQSVEARKLIVSEQDGTRLQVRLAHPLYGEAVRAQCSELRSRQRRRDLADALEAAGGTGAEDTLRIAVWRLETGTAHDPEPMLAACRIAWAAGDLPLATRLGWAALNAGGGVDAVVTLAMVLNYRERFDDAAAALSAAGEGPFSDADRAQLTATRAYTVAYGERRTDTAIQLLRDGEQTIDGPPRQTLAAMRGELEVVTGRAADGVPTLEAVLAQPDVPPPTLARAHTMAALGTAHLGRRSDSLAVIDRLLDAIGLWQDSAPYEEPRSRFVRHLAHLFAGELSAAEEAIAELDTNASREWHWDVARGVTAASMAQLARLRGQTTVAQRRSRDAIVAFDAESSTFAPFCLGESAHAKALAGDGRGSRDQLAEADRRRSPGFELFNYWIDIARPWSVAGGGDLSAAVGHALDTASRAHDAGLIGFEVIAAHDAVRLGAGDRAADRLLAAAARAEGPYPAVCADHVSALTAADPNALLAVADRFANLQLVVHAAEAAAQAAEQFRTEGQASRSRAAAKAWSFAQRGDGVRTPALAALRAPGLTRSEREIAHLAAAGLSSREIAARLVKSVRTVDNHLGSIYTKLGVRSRQQLAELFGEEAER